MLSLRQQGGGNLVEITRWSEMDVFRMFQTLTETLRHAGTCVCRNSSAITKIYVKTCI